MKTKLEAKPVSSDATTSIAVSPAKTAFSFRDVIEDGTPIDTWAEAVSREERVISKKDVIAHLEDLEARRKSIEDGVLRRAHHAIYLLLGDCLALATLASQSDPKSVRDGAVDEFLKSRNLSAKSSEPLFSRVVTAVFGAMHPTRVSSYRTVLRVASAEGISPAQLPEWIEDQGGIQEIRVTASKGGSGRQSEMANLTLEYLLDQGSLCAVQSDELSKQTSIESNNKEVVLVATKKPNGTFMVHTVIEEAPAVKKALELYQRKYQEQIKEFKYELKYRPSTRAS